MPVFSSFEKSHHRYRTATLALHQRYIQAKQVTTIVIYVKNEYGLSLFQSYGRKNEVTHTDVLKKEEI